MPHPLELKLAAAWPPSDWADVTVLVAVSGGGDSVALLRAMTALETGGQGRICVAHLNHQLRPDADEDERFVVELSRRLGVACEVERVAVDRLAAQAGDGLEAAARSARYRFLEQAAGRLGARFVATAHTADDQAETILHRIVRGTGVRGLAGMARVRPLGHATLIRPLAGRPPRGIAGLSRRDSASPIATTRATPTGVSRATASAMNCCRDCAGSSIRAPSRPCCGWARWPAKPKRLSTAWSTAGSTGA